MFNSIRNYIQKLRPIKPLFVAHDIGDKSKPTLVLLHGIAASSKTWKYVINEIDKTDYRIVVLDLLGFGQSPKPSNINYNVGDHVKYIRKTLKKLDIEEPFALVGHSMGSIIAANYCVRYPHHVDHLFLLSPPIYFKDTSGHSRIGRKKTDLYMKAYQYLSDNKDFTLTHSARIRNILKLEDGIEVSEDTWDSFRLSLLNTIVDQNTFDDIKQITIPTYIFYGLFDEFLVQESVKKLAKFGNVDIVKIPAADHALSQRFAREIARQIEKVY